MKERPPEWYCGAPNPKRGKICRNRAGAMTDHLGVGQCRLHGGNRPPQVLHAKRQLSILAAQRALAKFAQPIAVDPEQALLDLVSEAAGNVAWLGARVAELAEGVLPEGVEPGGPGATAVQADRGRWRTLTGYSQGAGLFGPSIAIDKEGGEHIVGEEARGMVKLYGEWADRLQKYAKAALEAGIERRRVEMAEKQGETIVVVVNNVLMKVGLGTEQLATARRLIAEEFRLMDREEIGR